MTKFNNNTDWYIEMADYIINSFWDIWKYKIRHIKSISALFLAWAPWAWKTEFLDTIFKDLKENFIVIDIDIYRNLFDWYNWENSDEFQKWSVKVADKILSFCFKNNLNFVFDGTFRNFNKIKENFWQCEKYNRKSLITLIFQEPRVSFYYTFLRKIKKKRNVPITIFIDWFYSSIENVFKAISIFDNVDLIIAHKIYSFLDKDKWVFKIDYKTNNINNFCEKYRILYKKWEFKNRENLKLDIIKYNNILLQEKLEKGNLYLKTKIWAIEKFFKSF